MHVMRRVMDQALSGCGPGLTVIVNQDSILRLLHDGPQPSPSGFARANQKAASYSWRPTDLSRVLRKIRNPESIPVLRLPSYPQGLRDFQYRTKFGLGFGCFLRQRAKRAA